MINRGSGSAMSKRYIRAVLRGATAVGLLGGWDGPFVDESYCLVENGRALMYSRAGAIDVCLRLRVLGVQPLYRASEPIEL
jgi:hypothetical protein